MKEKEFLDELSTFPEWSVFGKVISDEIARRMDEGEIPCDYAHREDFCELGVLENVISDMRGLMEDELISFIAKLARMKYQYELGLEYEKEWNETIKAIENGVGVKQ